MPFLGFLFRPDTNILAVYESTPAKELDVIGEYLSRRREPGDCPAHTEADCVGTFQEK